MPNIDPNKMQFIADRETRRLENKTIAGNAVRLVAIQKSRRLKKRKRTNYVYHIVGTTEIIYNRSRHGIFFMSLAVRPQNKKNFFDVFVEPPLTEKEQEWLERYDYKLV
ncbi:hypothetical protein LCGC14_0372650 [marine sediment metagenome]|uniref:Uncharacterized protein n=1 Tax=marine sediment metagenome TaxID=412755 RepID=A0A0F9TAM3_9ZZZZ